MSIVDTEIGSLPIHEWLHYWVHGMEETWEQDEHTVPQLRAELCEAAAVVAALISETNETLDHFKKENERLCEELRETRDFRDRYEAMAAVAMRACNNWREWPGSPSCDDHEHPDWKAATRAFIEREELRATVASVSRMLGWMNVPPRETLERNLSENRLRLESAETENERLRVANQRINQACDIFEKNSANAVELFERVRELESQQRMCNCTISEQASEIARLTCLLSVQVTGDDLK